MVFSHSHKFLVYVLGKILSVILENSVNNNMEKYFYIKSSEIMVLLPAFA